MLEDSRNTEITNFYRSILIHKNILSLEISMKDFAIVNMLNRKCHLYKPIKYLVLAVTNFTYLFLIGYFCV